MSKISSENREVWETIILFLILLTALSPIVYGQRLCITPLTISNDNTSFWIDEYGFMIPIITTVFAFRLGAMLKEARKEANLTQEELAERTGTKKTTYPE